MHEPFSKANRHILGRFSSDLMLFYLLYGGIVYHCAHLEKKQVAIVIIFFGCDISQLLAAIFLFYNFALMVL